MFFSLGLIFPGVCPTTVNTEAGAHRPGIASVAHVMELDTLEPPVPPVSVWVGGWVCVCVCVCVCVWVLGGVVWVCGGRFRGGIGRPEVLWGGVPSLSLSVCVCVCVCVC